MRGSDERPGHSNLEHPAPLGSQAGLLTIPMGGVLVSSIVADRLISRTRKLKPYVVGGFASAQEEGTS